MNYYLNLIESILREQGVVVNVIHDADQRTTDFIFNDLFSDAIVKYEYSDHQLDTFNNPNSIITDIVMTGCSDIIKMRKEKHYDSIRGGKRK